MAPEVCREQPELSNNNTPQFRVIPEGVRDTFSMCLRFFETKSTLLLTLGRCGEVWHGRPIPAVSPRIQL